MSSPSDPSSPGTPPLPAAGPAGPTGPGGAGAGGRPPPGETGDTPREDSVRDTPRDPAGGRPARDTPRDPGSSARDTPVDGAPPRDHRSSRRKAKLWEYPLSKEETKKRIDMAYQHEVEALEEEKNVDESMIVALKEMNDRLEREKLELIETVRDQKTKARHFRLSLGGKGSRESRRGLPGGSAEGEENADDSCSEDRENEDLERSYGALGPHYSAPKPKELRGSPEGSPGGSETGSGRTGVVVASGSGVAAAWSSAEEMVSSSSAAPKWSPSTRERGSSSSPTDDARLVGKVASPARSRGGDHASGQKPARTPRTGTADGDSKLAPVTIDDDSVRISKTAVIFVLGLCCCSLVFFVLALFYVYLFGAAFFLPSGAGAHSASSSATSSSASAQYKESSSSPGELPLPGEQSTESIEEQLFRVVKQEPSVQAQQLCNIRINMLSTTCGNKELVLQER